MQDLEKQGQCAVRADSPDQTSTTPATLTSKAQAAGVMADHGESNTPRNNYEPAISNPSTQAAIASPHHGTFNMSRMGNNLPAMSHHPQETAQYIQGTNQPYSPTTSPPMTHQPPPMPGFGGSQMAMANNTYYIGPTQMSQFYQSGHLPHMHTQQGMHTRPNIVYYANQMIMNHAQPGFYYPQEGHLTHPSSLISPKFSSRISNSRVPRVDGRYSQYGGNSNRPSRNQDKPSSKQSAVRGPPRKPRQSGHALWIGNLPPHADLMALVEHICKETSGMESLFLISKSNCAFANYKDDATCSAAQQALHDSKFQSVRLVSRLRKNTVQGSPGTTAPIGPAVTAVDASNEPDNIANQKIVDGEGSKVAVEVETVVIPATEPRKDGQSRTHVDKFFILKSLTTEDLDLSVKTGIWATQTHNEENLNQAFQSADNVYLIFSANKSGEYFGYARMLSKMNNDPAAAIEFAPKAMIASEVDLPKAITTNSTEFSPRGKIIDDSARGTIFWEAQRDESDAGSDVESETTSEKSAVTEDEAKTWGKPFELEWLSTTRLPFFRTRGLRNPWNSNREVKIARDGTELEPSVGRRLIGLFKRVQNSALVAPGGRGPMNFVPANPPVRPFE